LPDPDTKTYSAEDWSKLDPGDLPYVAEELESLFTSPDMRVITREGAEEEEGVSYV
jgi:hypothetical protein